MAILIWLKLLLFVHFCSSYFVIYCGCFVLHRYCRLQLFPIIVTILSAHPFLFMAPPFLPFIHPVKMTYQSGPELESGQYGHLSDPVFGDHLGGGSGDSVLLVWLSLQLATVCHTPCSEWRRVSCLIHIHLAWLAAWTLCPDSYFTTGSRVACSLKGEVAVWVYAPRCHRMIFQ